MTGARVPAAPRHEANWLILATFLLVVQGLFLKEAAYDKGDTVDEQVYVDSAWPQMGGQRVSMNALPVWGFGVALRLSRISCPIVHGRASLSTCPDALFPARLATVFIVMLAGIVLWLTARRLGHRVAALAHAAWCLSPTLLGHGSLAALDAWVATSVALAFWTGVRLAERPSYGRWVVAGVASAACIAAKITAIGVAPVVCGLGLWATIDTESWSRATLLKAGRGLAVFVVAFLVAAWGLYAFSFDKIHFVWRGEPKVIGPLPFPQLLRSFIVQSHHGFVAGYGIAGQVAHSKGRWAFYLPALAYKTSLVIQALMVGRLALLPLRLWRRRWGSLGIDGVLLAYPAVLFLVMSGAKIQSLRYLLPAMPFMVVVAARFVTDIEEVAVARVKVMEMLKTAACTVPVVAAFYVALEARPDFLMYRNPWATRGKAERSLDWGSDWCQDKRAVARWQKEHGVSRVSYLPCGGIDAKAWGVNAQLPSCTPKVGAYALHLHVLFGAAYAGCADWLTREPPDELLGRSIALYQVDQARLRRLEGLAGGGRAPWLVRTTCPNVPQTCLSRDVQGASYLFCPRAAVADARATCAARGGLLARIAPGLGGDLIAASRGLCTPTTTWLIEDPFRPQGRDKLAGQSLADSNADHRCGHLFSDGQIQQSTEWDVARPFICRLSPEEGNAQGP